MTSLRLALRGLRARAGLSAALLAVTTFAVGVGAAGAIYLRAAGESLLAQNLRTATSYTAGLHVSQVVADGQELRSLTGSQVELRTGPSSLPARTRSRTSPARQEWMKGPSAAGSSGS